MTETTHEFNPVAPMLSNTQRWSKIIAPVLLSRSEFFKLFAMVLLVSPFFGLPGIFFLVCMHILRRKNTVSAPCPPLVWAVWLLP
jgi:hypothetical protein